VPRFLPNGEGQILAGCERVVPTRFFSARYRAGSLTAPILEHLDKFIIADDVTLEDLTLAFTTIAVEGPKSADVFTATRAPALETCHGANVEWGTALLARLSVTGSPRVFIILPTTEKDEILLPQQNLWGDSGSGSRPRL